MKIKVNPTTDGKLSKQYTTLISHKTGEPYDIDHEEAFYWASRAVKINQDFCDGDPDFTVKVVPGND